ncbi:MAG: hypothetical protein J3Q66DRAFT_39915 [Benniella sp.]|nr:MAG: hypothetical protein J3Q66DRAFT_39915 [Benniella sp.]
MSSLRCIAVPLPCVQALPFCCTPTVPVRGSLVHGQRSSRALLRAVGCKSTTVFLVVCTCPYVVGLQVVGGGLVRVIPHHSPSFLPSFHRPSLSLSLSDLHWPACFPTYSPPPLRTCLLSLSLHTCFAHSPTLLQHPRSTAFSCSSTPSSHPTVGFTTLSASPFQVQQQQTVTVADKVPPPSDQTVVHTTTTTTSTTPLRGLPNPQ